MSPYMGATELTTVLPAAVSIGTNTTPLTIAEIASMAAEISSELDSACQAAGYTVPVATTAGAYAMLSRYCKDGVGAIVLGILAPNAPGVGGRLSLAGEFRARYEAALKMIREGKLPLPGASFDTTDGDGGRELPRSYETSNTGATWSGATPILSVGQDF